MRNVTRTVYGITLGQTRHVLTERATRVEQSSSAAAAEPGSLGVAFVASHGTHYHCHAGRVGERKNGHSETLPPK